MPESPQDRERLSEIGHLFLSSVRDKQTQGAAPRPVRVPPPRTAHFPARADCNVELTAEEMAHVFGGTPENCGGIASKSADGGAALGPITVLLAAHLGDDQYAWTRHYTAALCEPGQRIGLLSVDVGEVRLSIFAHGAPAHEQPRTASDVMDPRALAETLNELAWDVDRWLLLLPAPRGPEARELLRAVPNWTLLTRCDDACVVNCYRTLKGLSDLPAPRITLATLDGAPLDAANVAARLSNVCEQFLNWSITHEPQREPASNVAEHVVYWANTARDKAQLAAAPQWRIISNFVKRGAAHSAAAESANAQPAAAQACKGSSGSSDTGKSPLGKSSFGKITPDKTAPVDALGQSLSKPTAQPHTRVIPQAAPPVMTTGMPRPDGVTHPPTPLEEVIDLPGGGESVAELIGAVLRGSNGELIECPSVRPPTCPTACLSLNRERQLVLLVAATTGLKELNEIGRGYQWLIENRGLIKMALPQLPIDAHRLPILQLLVDQNDLAAAILQPLLQSGSVRVQAYRKLRWGQRTGLLLEAA